MSQGKMYAFYQLKAMTHYLTENLKSCGSDLFIM